MIDRTSLRVALRTLARHRGFTIVAVASLAIAIALNTAMYSVLEAMLAPRINARAPDQLYSVEYYGPVRYYRDMRRRELAEAEIENALRVGLDGFGEVTGSRPGYDAATSLIEFGERYRRSSFGTVRVVRPNFFDVLGSTFREGRGFLSTDEQGAVAIISDRYADYFFPGQSAVGKMLTVDGNGYTVVGVIERSDVLPLLSADFWMLRAAGTLSVPPSVIRLVRRAKDTSVEQELSVVASRLAMATGGAPGSSRFLSSGFATARMPIGRFHWALIGAVAAVLLVACANLANLQLARGIARARELAVRAAVGASRRQLVTHLMLETGILAVAGMGLGVFATAWANSLIKATIPPVMSEYLIAPQTSWGMFAFATFAAVVCLVLSGLLPALRLSRVDLDTLLKAGAGTGANRHHRRRYGALVIAQIGFALPVLIGAAIVARTALIMNGPDYRFRRMYGYDASPLVVANVVVRAESTPAARVLRLNDLAGDLVARARSVPGVHAAAVEMYRRPVRNRVMVDDENGVLREEPAPLWSYGIVSPQSLRTVGWGIETGRDFADGEFDGRSIIMDAPSARFLWGNRNPIGRVIKLGDAKSDMPWLTVVGIIRDDRDTVTIRRVNPTANYRLGLVYRVITPRDSLVVGGGDESITMYARTRGNTELASVRIQRALRSDARYSRLNVIPLEQRHGMIANRARQSFVASVFGTFGFVGLGLAAIGVFGIVAHSVAERRREFAVRISLGASTRDILHAVLREGNVLILAGIAMGLLLTRDSIWWLANFLEEDAGYDAVFMAIVAAVLFAIAALAAVFPAWRATRIDPVEALRHE